MTNSEDAPDDPGSPGNTILFEKDNIFIIFSGECFHTFNREKKGIRYISNMGSNKIAYPIALGESITYS